MRKSAIILSLALSAIMVSCRQTGTDVTQADLDRFAPVEEMIRNSWDKYVESKEGFPYPYSYALNPGTFYYWDLYFHNQGLILQGRRDIAFGNLEDLICQVERHGFIPNADGWGENRSQNPVFSMAVRRFWETSDKSDKEWLRKAWKAVQTEYRFWTDSSEGCIEDHSTAIDGLQRYGHHADSTYLIYFYDRVLKHRFGLEGDVPSETKLLVAGHRLAEAECQDFTPRFEGRCMDYIPVDLTCMLYGMERDLAYFERELGMSGEEMEAAAKRRAALINKYCWDAERGMYLDYDFVNGHHSPIASMATFLPLKYGIASKRQARRIVRNLPLFDSDGGIVVCEPSQDGIHYQWGYNAVWAPIQMFMMDALHEAGYFDEERQVALKWLNTVADNYYNPCPATHRPFKYGDGTRHPGALYEKYTRDGHINDDEYPCSVMLGWTASAFVQALEVVR